MFDFTSEKGLRMVAAAHELIRENSKAALHVATVLRRQFANVESATLAMAQTLAQNRNKAASLGEWTQRGLFTSTMLQQSSHPALSKLHAQRYAGLPRVVEICTGAGVDTVALARTVDYVDTYDIDPVVARYTMYNLGLQDVNNVRVHCEDASNLSLKPEAIWSDPSRRTDKKRIVNPELYAPPLSYLESLGEHVLTGVKVAPACEIPPGWCGEYTGVDWQCQELVLWKNCEIPHVAAVIAHDNGEASTWVPPTNDEKTIRVRTLDGIEGCQLIEPHPCVLRTNALAQAFAHDGLTGLDPTIAFAIAESAEHQVSFPCRRFEILAVISADFATVNKLIRHHNLDSGTQIKKRGFHLESQIIRKKLKFARSGAPGILLFTRAGTRRICLLMRKLGDSTT